MSSSSPTNLVLIGAGEYGKIAFEYFTYDSDFTVSGFAVERKHIKENELYGVPVVPFEEIDTHFPPNAYAAHVAITYTQLNRVRRRLYEAAKGRGYKFANYISSKAFVWRNATIGENVFIFENNVVQPFTAIGNNVVLWSGNHIGHRTIVRDHVYISSHTVISGYCDIGESSFIGVNATLADRVQVGPDSFIGMASGVMKSLEGGLVYTGTPAIGRISALRYMKVKD